MSLLRLLTPECPASLHIVSVDGVSLDVSAGIAHTGVLLCAQAVQDMCMHKMADKLYSNLQQVCFK
eukprot:scaffold8510_cov19-Tisochrysis_lutea.AAC.1